MIFTSYFGVLRKIDPDTKSICIAVVPPYWYKGLRAIDDDILSSVVPPRLLVGKYKAGKVTPEKYRDVYMMQLHASKKRVLEAAEFFDSINAVLLCYERPDEFCHRQLLAEFLREEGYDVKEMVFPGDSNGK